MLNEIGNKSRVGEYVKKAKDKDDPFRLMGFGHRVYKNYDPRATVMMQSCHEVLDDLGINDPLLELAMELEKIAREDEYFVERNLYPNVDFYSAPLLYELGIPTDLFTPLFAMSRVAGWTAHVLEQYKNNRLIRPRARYVGQIDRTFTPLQHRSEKRF